MSHTFTPIHFIRLLIIFWLGWLVYRFVPVSMEYIPEILNPLIVNLLFIFLAGFLINRTLDRNRLLDLGVSLELSRMRRIAHLVERMDVKGAWKIEVRERIEDYLKRVSKNDFINYNKSHEAFRKLTHTLYSFVAKTDRDKQIFSELLTVTRDTALHRQQIANHLRSSISPYVWVSITLVALLDLATFVVSREPGGISSVLMVAGVIGVLLVFDILVELDMITSVEQRYYQRMYEQNAKDIHREDWLE